MSNWRARWGCTQIGTSAAPTLFSIWGTEVQLVDGLTVAVDGEYARRSITELGADGVKGYHLVMPAFPMEDDEVYRLVGRVRRLA